MLETDGFVITTVRKPSASISSKSQSVDGRHRGRSRFASQQRHLAKHIAAAKPRDLALVPASVTDASPRMTTNSECRGWP